MTIAPVQLTATEFKQLLSELGWRQTDLARRTGYTTNTVSRWATGDLDVPLWMSEYLNAMLAIRSLAVRFGVIGKPSVQSPREAPEQRLPKG